MLETHQRQELYGVPTARYFCLPIYLLTIFCPYGTFGISAFYQSIESPIPKLKLFRNICKKPLLKNQVNRYPTAAIEETLLVNWLWIAIQINNRNKEWKNGTKKEPLTVTHTWKKYGKNRLIIVGKADQKE